MNRFVVTASAAAVVALGSSAFADLTITEIMSSVPSGGSSAINGDWWELTNRGPVAVALGGFAWADTEDMLGGPTPQLNLFGAINIGPGESIIILEESSANVAAWRTNWGLEASVQVLSEDDMVPDPTGNGDTFSGLSSSGDAVFFYDPMGNLLDSFVFGSATAGTTFERDAFGNNLGLSVVGENGAYSAANGNIGSPGYAVPAPGAASLLMLAGLAARRRR